MLGIEWMILHPVACGIAIEIITLTSLYVGYKFGYELLMLNGALTFAGLALIKKETVKYKQ